ncbi:ribonuclease H-like domain-containing protein [Tanacetum coccineum]
MFTCTLAQYVAYKTNVAQQFTPQKHYRLPHPGQGILGPAPAIYASQPTPLPSAFSTMPLQDPTWHMDTGASSHLNFNASNLSTIFDKRLFPSVHVGDGKSIPVTNTGHSIIPSHHRPLHLHNVLVTPNIIKNLISVRQFTRDNNCTIEFDAFGFSVKDYLTRHILLRCDSSSDLYPVTKPSTSPIAFLSTSASTWHQRLGHPASSSVLLQQIVDSLHKEFDMIDLGALNYFLGISVVRHPTGEPHFAALKRIMRYVQGTLELGLQLYASATTSLVGYTDADWAGCPSTRRSTSGYCVFLETAWIRNLLRELHSPLLTATMVYCDNVSAVYMSANPVQHQRTKHIEIDIHFVRDMVKAGHVWVLHVPSRFQYASSPKVFPQLCLKIFASV